MKDYKYTINGNKYNVSIEDITNNIVNVIVNGETYIVEMEEKEQPEKPKIKVQPTVAHQSENVTTSNPLGGRPNYQNAVKAPLPGIITEITVSVGDKVKSGDTVIILEAMKMANNIEAEKSGKVNAIFVQPGQNVMEGDVLIAID